MICLSVVIVNYNGASYLEETIFSLINALKGKVKIQLVIQDNYSNDNSVEVLNTIKSKLSDTLDFVLIKSGENVGFAKAINEMIRLAAYERIMILNNDTVVKCLDGCLDFIENNSNYIIAPKLYNIDGTVQKSTFSYPNNIRLLVELFGLKSTAKSLLSSGFFKNNTKELKVDYFSGCVLFFEKKLFLGLDGFNVSYYFYHEECDLFMRAERFEINKRFISSDYVVHYGGGGGHLSDYSYVAYYTNLCRLYMEHGRFGRIFYWFVFTFVFCTQYFINYLAPISLSPFKSVYQGDTSKIDRKYIMGNNRKRFKMIVRNINQLIRGK